MDIMLFERGGGTANCGDDGFATVVLAVVAGSGMVAAQKIPRNTKKNRRRSDPLFLWVFACISWYFSNLVTNVTSRQKIRQIPGQNTSRIQAKL